MFIRMYRDTPEPVDYFCIFFSDLTIFSLEIFADFCYFNAVVLRHTLHTPMQYSIISPFWQPVNDGNALFYPRFRVQVGHIANLGFFSANFKIDYIILYRCPTKNSPTGFPVGLFSSLTSGNQRSISRVRYSYQIWGFASGGSAPG